MTGFIKGLFRSKPKADAAEPVPTEAPQPENQPGAYYLPPDEAKTFGNLEYMRSAKSIRRTFPKKKMGEDNEMIRTISAMEMQKAAENGNAASMQSMARPATNGSANGTSAPKAEPQANSANSSANSSANNSANTERRQADSSMDMFRNMARDLKKR